MTSDEMATRQPRAFTDDSLREIQTFDQAMSLVAEYTGGVIESIDDYGNGFEVLPTADKPRLKGVPFMILEWRFAEGKEGEMVTAMIVTEQGEKLILNDGSTGVKDQLKRITAKRIADRGMNPVAAQTNLHCPRGVRVSTYPRKDETGAIMLDGKGLPLMGTTIYLD